MRRMMVVALFGLAFPTAAGVAASPAKPAQGTAPEATDLSTLRAGHPRLFADVARIEAIKRQDDRVTRDLRAAVMAQAKLALGKPDVLYPPAGSNTEYPGPGGKFEAMREVQGRLLALGMAYRLTGERRYADKARHDLMGLVAVPDWNPRHYLTLAEGALAAAIGYDWFYAELSPAERDTIADAIRTKALIPSLDVQPGISGADRISRSWLDGVYNWNPVVNGSLATAALAIAERDPALARRIVNRTIHYIQFAGRGYAPDGSWAEAPNYWAFGTSYYVLTIEALRSALGTDFGLTRHPGFLRTGDYNLQVWGPTGAVYNYSDTSEEYQNEPAMTWLARETQRPDLLVVERNDIARAAGRDVRERLPGHVFRPNRHTPLELIWWLPDLLKATARPTQPPLHWTARGGLPLGVMRTGWGDPDATFVALKGGTASDSHSHMDGGSFILEAGGVRWAVDPGSESYDSMRRVKLDLWNMAQGSERWATFRVGPEGHNILRLDADQQSVFARARIAPLSGKGVVGNTLDMSGYYPGRTSSLTRTVRLVRLGVVDIRDRWTLTGRPADVTFQWLTRATPTRTTTGLRLTQDGRTLEIDVAPVGATIAIEDASAPRAPQDSPNPGLRRILIRRHTPALGAGEFHLTARLTAR